MAQLRIEGDFIGPGEKKTAAYLEENLPNSWVVICNKELVNPDRSTREVDFIIVGKHRVFAVEEKSWQNQIHGTDGSWILNSGESVRSPLNLAAYVARRLASYLRDNVPRLHEQVPGHFVFPRVILSADEVELFVRDARMREQVYRLEGCEEHLKRWDQAGVEDASIEAFRTQIANRLAQLRNRPKLPAEIREYRIAELIRSHGPVRSLRATHRDGTTRVLRLIERTRSAITDVEEKRDLLLLREYDTLKKLGEAGLAPRVDPYFSFDENAFWVVPVHAVSGVSLRTDRSEAAPSADRILKVAELCFRTLTDIHKQGVVHRSITPDRVVLTPEESSVFTDFAIARLEEKQTIAEEGEQLDADHVYRAPECRVGLEFAGPTSDTFSLGASLLYWVTGVERNEPTDPFQRIRDARDDLKPDIVRDLDDIFSECLQEDERSRPVPAEVAQRLKELRPPEVIPSFGDEQIQPGTVLEDRYEILRVLGRGGTATTYLARDNVPGTEVVLKRIHDPERIQRLARAEFLTLKDLAHPNLPRVYDIYPHSSPFHLKLEYVRGSSLKEVWDQFVGKAEAVTLIGLQVLDALIYLESNQLIHRDVSPGNILLPDEEAGPIRLIDFGMATAGTDSNSVVGTPPYRPPEIERGEKWTAAGDQYSLGVVLFRLATGRYPYEIQCDQRLKDRLVEPTAEENREIGAGLLRVLITAVSPDPSSRFGSASEFRQALQTSHDAPATPEPQDFGQRAVNPFVDELRQAYRNSRVGNRNNRGIETEFAARTYVETRLDTVLLPQILGGDLRIVILSGNPGDGKTAFLQRIEAALEKSGATVEDRDGAGWKIRSHDHVFSALYDASASYQDRSSDDLVAGVLQPLAGPGEAPPGYTALLAVNDGRLLDYFHRNGDLRFGWIWTRLRRQIQGTAGLTDGVLLIDLKRRSLAGLAPDGVSLFKGILDQFSDASNWTVCERCVARADCPILANAKTLRDPNLAGTVREHLHRITLAAHWRRERRATIRDFRSAVSFLITHDVGCSEIHEERSRGVWPLGVSDRLFFNSAFSGDRGEDVLLTAWRDFDAALVPAPTLDRFLHFHRAKDQVFQIDRLFKKPTERVSVPIPDQSVEQARRIRELKRRLAFEADSEALRDVSSLCFQDFTPYRHLDGFRRAVGRELTPDSIRARLLRGISLADGVPRGVVRSGLSVRVGRPEGDALVVIKHFPEDDFRVDVSSMDDGTVESVPDHLVLRHVRGDLALEVDLDLWELLLRAEEGFQSGAEEQRATYEELEVFKNRLLVHPSQEVVLVEADCRAQRVTVRDGKIVHEHGAGL